MKTKTLAALSIAGLMMMSAAPGWAGPVGIARTAPSGVEAQLMAKRDDVSNLMLKSNARGPLLVRYMNRYSQLTDLINRVQNGQTVSEDEINQALQPVTGPSNY